MELALFVVGLSFLSLTDNGSYMKRGFAPMFQISTNLSSHVLYTVLAVRCFYDY